MKEFLAMIWLYCHVAIAFALLPWNHWILPAMGHEHCYWRHPNGAAAPYRRWLTIIRSDNSGMLFGRCKWFCYLFTALPYHPGAFEGFDTSRIPWWKVIDERNVVA